MKIKYALLLLLLPLMTQAKDLELIGGSQADFRNISKDIVATIDYKALGPAEAGGLTGFSVGTFATYVTVDNEASWTTATGEDIDELGLVGIQANKGLPFDIDVGAYFSAIPTTSVKVYGAELRYAFLPGSAVLPAVAIRGTYSKLTGIDNFDVDSKSVDLSVSKGFAFVTPYAGVGRVFGTSDPDASSGLTKEDIEATKLFAGVRFGFGLFEMTPEYTRIGDNNAYNLRLGLGF